LIILIDGYNLLKQLFPGLKETLEKQKNYLIKQLGYYKQKKLHEIKEIILVFDGGPFRHASREIHSGIVVIYSGQNSTADEWIIDFVEKNKEKEILLISLDRKLISCCQKYGADSLNVFDFYKILQSTLLEDIDIAPKQEKSDIQKYEDIKALAEDENQAINNKALDLLMEQASFGLEKKEDDLYEQQSRESKAQKISKQEKKIYKKLKKL
jgi:predicted RNA-binding protein with PIN domain